jgi:hypothetical protein
LFPLTLNYSIIELHDFINFTFEHGHFGIITGSKILHLDSSGLMLSFINLFLKKIFFYVLSSNILFFRGWASLFFPWSYYAMIWFINNWYSKFFSRVFLFGIISITYPWLQSLRLNLILLFFFFPVMPSNIKLFYNPS